MRIAYYTEDIWKKRGTLFMTFHLLGALFIFAFMPVLAWAVIYYYVIPFIKSPNTFDFFSSVLCLAAVVSCVWGISLCLCYLSFYKLSQEGIIIRTLWFTSTIRWDEIRRIAIYTMYEERMSKIVGDFIVVCKKGKKMRELLIADNYYWRRKSFFIIRYTEERAAEFAPYWPEEIRRGIQKGKINREL